MNERLNLLFNMALIFSGSAILIFFVGVDPTVAFLCSAFVVLR